MIHIDKMKKEINAVLIGLLGLIFLIGILVLKGNFIFFVKIWGLLFGVGIVFFPITSRIFSRFNDKGWIFSKVIGISLIGIVVWNLSYLKILKFGEFGCYLIFALFFLINFFLVRKKVFKVEKESLTSIILSEIVFTLAYMFWVYIRSYHVGIDCFVEQFMNYGFMNKLMSTSYLPADDIWLSGHTINYYYYGQFNAALICKLSFTGIKEGYGMMLSLISACTFVFPFSIAFNLGKEGLKDSKKWVKTLFPTIIALIAGISISIGGTMYYPIYKWIVPREDGSTYYYWEVVRYIGYRPETNDKTITDIPAYSNMAQDLHAHYVDLFFGFTTIAVLLALILKEKKEKNRLLDLNIGILGILLGIQRMTNYWDFPIYGVIITIVLIANNFIKYRDKKSSWLELIVQILEIFMIQELVTVLFSSHMYISATKVLFTNITSPFYKLAVLWGLPIVGLLLFIVYFFANVFKKNKNEKVLDKIFSKNKSDIFVLILGLCALGLIIMPEIIYLKDIYSDEYKRANTMFKLTYPAFVLFCISESYIIVKLISIVRKKVKNIVLCILAIVLLGLQITTWFYGFNAIGYVFKTYKTRKSMDTVESYVSENYLYDYLAIQWIKDNIDRDSVIVEAASSSYEISGRIGVYTGNPTVLAWYGHEWIWRANADYSVPNEVYTRWNEVWELYNSKDPDRVKELCDKYNISYIYFGEVEAAKGYKSDYIRQVGNVVYSNEKVVIIQVNK